MTAATTIGRGGGSHVVLGSWSPTPLPHYCAILGLPDHPPALLGGPSRVLTGASALGSWKGSLAHRSVSLADKNPAVADLPFSDNLCLSRFPGSILVVELSTTPCTPSPPPPPSSSLYHDPPDGTVERNPASYFAWNWFLHAPNTTPCWHFVFFIYLSLSPHPRDTPPPLVSLGSRPSEHIACFLDSTQLDST